MSNGITGDGKCYNILFSFIRPYFLALFTVKVFVTSKFYVYILYIVFP